MIKIAIVDDEPKQTTRGVRLLTDVFKELGVTPEFLEYTYDVALPAEKVLATLEAQLVQERPHIIICDNKMGGKEAWGQMFIAKLKVLLPEAVVCLMTREILKSLQFGLRTPNPDLIIDKGHLGGEDTYRKYIGEKLVSLLKRSSILEANWNTSFEIMFSKFRDARGRRATGEEVNSLLEQCLFSGNIYESRKSVVINRLAGGRSGSVVMGCRLSGDLSYGVTGVIKISSRKDTLREIENYNTYVKWVLPYTWKVEILGTGFTEGMGAICYSFAFDGDGKPTSCTDLLKQADDNIVNVVCQSIFNAKSKTWYSQLRQSDLDASEYFQRPPFFSKSQIQEREDKLVQKMADLFQNRFQVTDREIELFGYAVPKPSRLLFTEDWGPVEECVCHGDLNANNILINSGTGRAAFIDFQSTGFHNIFRDFVSFESSIRIDWAKPIEQGEIEGLLRSEIDVADNLLVSRNGYLSNVKAVRRAAFENFKIDPDGRRKNLYLLAAYVHFSWLATRFDDWTKDGYVRLILGAFAALIVLARNASS